MTEINGNKCHSTLAKKITPKLAFDKNRVFYEHGNINFENVYFDDCSDYFEFSSFE